MHRDQIEIKTSGRGFTDVTQRISTAVEHGGIVDGLCHLFLRHTSASLLISENADPDVLTDLETFFAELVPDGDRRYLHQAEGPDDMPAHVRSVLTASELTVPVSGGRLELGTWQAVYLYEHRHRPHRRRIQVSVF